MITRTFHGIEYVVHTPSVYVVKRYPQISITWDGFRWNIVSPGVTRSHGCLEEATAEFRRAVDIAIEEVR